MPPFLLISASAYLEPSTSLCASAERTPVSGFTMPILIGVSPRAVRMNGDATCRTPAATPARKSVRRAMGPGAEILIIGFLPDGLIHGPADFFHCAGDAPICLAAGPPSRGFKPSDADPERLHQSFETGDHGERRELARARIVLGRHALDRHGEARAIGLDLNSMRVARERGVGPDLERCRFGA